MKYILDTDTLIYFLKGHAGVIKQIADVPSDAIATTIINHTELLYGAHNSIKKKSNLIKIQGLLDNLNILPFCKKSSHIFAANKALLKQQGNIIADLDLMIGSIAIQHKSTLVTNNTKHFARLAHLSLANWACL